MPIYSAASVIRVYFDEGRSKIDSKANNFGSHLNEDVFLLSNDRQESISFVVFFVPVLRYYLVVHFIVELFQVVYGSYFRLESSRRTFVSVLAIGTHR